MSNLCDKCGVSEDNHTTSNLHDGTCCPRFKRKSKDDEFADAWGAMTEDRSRYNLGDGCRRVPSRGGID